MLLLFHNKCLEITPHALGGGGGLEVGYQVSPLALLLDAGEDHLGAGDVLLGVGQVDVEGVLAPGDAWNKKKCGHS